MAGDTNNGMSVYTSCTNNVNMNTYGICWVLFNSKLHAVLQFVQGWDRWTRESYTDGRGQHCDSLSGTPYGCAMPSVHISGGSRDDVTTSALFQLMACIWSTACSAIADWAVFPDVNALLCCFR